MDRRTAIKAMLGGGLIVGGCEKAQHKEKRLTKLDHIKLVCAVGMVESENDSSKVGKAGEVGTYQLTKQYVDDVNRIRKINGVPFGSYHHAHRYNDGMCHAMLAVYWAHYATPERLGHEPTIEDLARIHNGGPNGWRKASTKVYWEKVKAELAKM